MFKNKKIYFIIYLNKIKIRLNNQNIIINLIVFLLSIYFLIKNKFVNNFNCNIS